MSAVTVASEKVSQNSRKRIILGITGSVAAVKGPEIAVRLVKECNFEVKVLLTTGGQHFWKKAKDYDPNFWLQFQTLLSSNNNNDRTNDDDKEKSDGEAEEEQKKSSLFHQEPSATMIAPDDEWKDWNRLGDPVMHIDLRDWADAIVVAPLSAHTLAKIAGGLCDDTLSCVLRAWDFGGSSSPSIIRDGATDAIRTAKPVVLAPAMNTNMYEHPITREQLNKIQSFAKGIVHIIEPQVKMLACGQVGAGALASVDHIMKTLQGLSI